MLEKGTKVIATLSVTIFMMLLVIFVVSCALPSTSIPSALTYASPPDDARIFLAMALAMVTSSVVR